MQYIEVQGIAKASVLLETDHSCRKKIGKIISQISILENSIFIHD